MKLSLKEWFLNEANNRSSTKKGSVGRKSSTNVQINVEEGVDERALSSYEHPHAHLAKKLSHKKGVKDPDALAAYIKRKELGEDLQLEYEDPTSSKHDSDDDSKWAGPKASHEGMPHLRPHDLAQQRAADGWEEMHKSSNRHYPETGEDLKGFFGDEPYPKSSKSSSHKSSRKVSEGEQAFDEPGGHGEEHEIEEEGPKALPSEMPASWLDQPMSMAPRKGQSSSPTKSTPKSSATPPVRSSQSQPVPWRAAQRASQAAAEPAGEEMPSFADLDDPDFMSKLGLEPDSPENTKKSAGPKMRDVVKSRSSSDDDEGEGDVSQYYDYGKDRRQHLLSPKLKPGAEVDDELGQTLASEPLGAEEAPAEGMGWDEFRASNPQAAEELEREVPDEEERAAATYQKKQDGRVYMDSPSGRRAYLGDELGWEQMDDGGTPAGEF